MWPIFCVILMISPMLGVKPNLRNAPSLQHQGNGPASSQWQSKYPNRAASKCPPSADVPCALHCALWMLVNQNIGRLLVSSPNALQLSSCIAWGVVPVAGAQKLCWNLCAGMGNTAVYSSSTVSTISFTSKKEESSSFSFLYNKDNNTLKVQIKLFNTGTAPEIP